MTRIYFENSHGVISQLCELNAKNSSEIMRAITDFCGKHNYKIPYSRIWNTKHSELGQVTCVDVGSHTEFFYISPAFNISSEFWESEDA